MPYRSDMETGYLNLAWAQALVAGLAAAGLQEAVISPGSRSTPFALAFLRHPNISTRVIIDERSAAFFALGLAKASDRPVALLCTSGSAVANWFPAVIEADLAAVPLLLLSADRPAELRGWGANQTLDQQNIFGRHVRASHALSTPDPTWVPAFAQHLSARLMTECRWPLAGPVHVNLPLREPLLPTSDDWPSPPALSAIPVALPQRPPTQTAVAQIAARFSARPGVILCGGGRFETDFAPTVTALAAALSVPILAEPLSGLRFGHHDLSHVLTRQEAFLRRTSFTAQHRPAWVLRFGDFPVSRSVQTWLGQCGADTVLVDPAGRWHDPQHAAEQVVQADPSEFCRALLRQPLHAAPAEWWPAFAREEERAAYLLSASPEPNAFEGQWLLALPAILPPGLRLFCGNSMIIRDVDTFSGRAARTLNLYCNRGASGIDGNISTAAGIAAAGPSLAILGDVTCAHDLGGLAAARGLNLVLVILNNGGGAIFGHLPQATLPEFEQAWLTPPKADFAHAAATWGIPYTLADNLGAALLTIAQALKNDGPHLIEIPVNRQASLKQHQAYWARVERGDAGD